MKRFMFKTLSAAVVCGGLLIATIGTRAAAQNAFPADNQVSGGYWQQAVTTEQAYQEALAKGDNHTVTGLLWDDFEWVVPGKIWSKADVVNNVSALKAEHGATDYNAMTKLYPRFYGSSVAVFYGMSGNPVTTHIWVKRNGVWKALVFFDVPPPPDPRPEPNNHPVNPDVQATEHCNNPCQPNSLPWNAKTTHAPITEEAKEALQSWEAQKRTESAPTSQEMINAWEVHTDMDGTLGPTEYSNTSRFWDLNRMWHYHITEPGGPYVISMYVWTLDPDVVMYLALQHASEHQTDKTTYAVRIWVKHPTSSLHLGFKNPYPLPWESDHIWQIDMSEADTVPNGTVPPYPKN